MPRRSATFEEVSLFFRENGCQLLSKKYVNSHTQMKYICKCGKRSFINFHAFKTGQRCKQCGIDRCSQSRRATINEVTKIFADSGCELLTTEYKNSSTPMPYKCSCGRESKICLGSFKSGNRCKWCGIQKRRQTTMIKQHDVKSCLSKIGCELLSDYKGANIPVKYRCECGVISFALFRNLMKGSRCKQCGFLKMSARQMTPEDEVKKFVRIRKCQYVRSSLDKNGQRIQYICDKGKTHWMSWHKFRLGQRCSCNVHHRFTIAAVKQHFEKNGCKLLSTEYINCKTTMPYVCSCGNHAKISFSNFQRGRRCRFCKDVRMIEARNKNIKALEKMNPNKLRQQISKRRKQLETQAV